MTVLLDTNVLVASVVPGHPHAAPSGDVLALDGPWLVAAHSLSEFQNTMTRPTRYGWPPLRALAVLQTIIARVDVRSLTADQSIAAIESFARMGVVGARIYDCLIGQVAVNANASAIVTWNTAHFTPLFPQFSVLTPAQYLETI